MLPSIMRGAKKRPHRAKMGRYAYRSQSPQRAVFPDSTLVAKNAKPPESGDCEEDWIRLPANDRDVAARLRALARRSSRHPALPEVDEDGRVHHLGRWVSTSPTEQRVITVLVERFGAVVTADELREYAWPDGPPVTGALRVHLSRLRHNIEPLGLHIRSLRDIGYVLEERDAD
jgi:hypothetical protein